jgi:hypothetical protein
MKISNIIGIALVTSVLSMSAAYATSSDSTITSSKKATSAAGTINIVSGTYGGNCTKKSIKGNVTKHLKDQCDGKKTCDYKIDAGVIGDPAYGCAKGYVAEFNCGSKTLKAELAPEASGSTLNVSCEASSSGSKKSSDSSKSTTGLKAYAE